MIKALTNLLFTLTCTIPLEDQVDIPKFETVNSEIPMLVLVNLYKCKYAWSTLTKVAQNCDRN